MTKEELKYIEKTLHEYLFLWLGDKDNLTDIDLAIANIMSELKHKYGERHEY